MKMIFIVLWAFILTEGANAQKAVFDSKHYQSVVANAAVRSSAETTHQQYLAKINTDIDNLNTNAGSVVLAQDMIYRSLSNVNAVLKDGLEVKYMLFIVSDIGSYISQSLVLVKADPFLLVFANGMTDEMRKRAAALVSDVSGFVLKEGGNMLADYNARDELLHKVITQLQIIDGLAFGCWKAMFWARQNGFLKSINPFRDFINHDRDYVTQIIRNAKYLKE
ncbi:hypothetical protein SAMN05192574_105306 [Mucilaginibacter gossypiicola]|uniref:Uncharacterized protein n=1 Tax=Mucilaginibacter gossypiicola TaxID=551995 RepID=A0A1H8LYD1_9SPHI|nr:hypothetical protein [Mucilaginibacter gossypiicola]SEO10154.1 hypothetical protein SAMN05192574_105306 [Mucilaginibacter gossypiicola]